MSAPPSHPLSSPTFPWSADSSLTPQQAVRSSCAALEPHCLHVRINRTSLRRYILSLPPSSLHPLTPRPLPLRFSLSSSLNFHCLLSFLQFGSGYRPLLHSLTGQGASDTVTYGLVACHISAPALNADYLSRLSVTDIGQLFRLPISEEYELRPAITSERRTALYPLADALRRVCNECGAVLRALQCEDFAAFILRTYQPGPPPTTPESAASLLTRLITHFPSLRDEYTLPGVGSVQLYKRAQLIVGELALHHAPQTARQAELRSEMLAYDVGSLTAFSDNVLPCVLEAEGVLEYGEELKGRVERGEEVGDERMQAELRAMSVVAVEEMVKVWNEERAVPEGESKEAGEDEAKEATTRRPITAMALDYHIWAVAGKEESMRKRPRHLSPDTVFY